MKKLLCILLVSSMVFTACEKEEVNGQQGLSDVLVTVDFSLIIERFPENEDEGEILMVASDKEGNVLASDKLDVNSETPYIFSLKSSNDFNEDELLLTIISHDKLNREVVLASYLVNKGQEWQFKPEPESWYERDPLDFIYMNVENMGQEKKIGVYGSDNSSGWTPRLGEPRYKIPLYKEPPLDYFIFHREQGSRDALQELISYKVLAGVEGREELEVDVESFSKDYTEYSIAVPDAEDFKISAVANVSDADLYSVGLGKLNQGSETTYKFPNGITLEDYLFTVGYEKRGMEFKSVVHSESPELNFREFDVDVRTSLDNTANRSVSLSFSKKSFDYHISTFEYYNDSQEDVWVWWFFILSPDFTEIKMFDVSKVILSCNPSWQDQMVYYGTEVVDLEAFDGYQSAQEFLMVHKDGIPTSLRRKEYHYIRKDFNYDQENGRVRSNSKRRRNNSFFPIHSNTNPSARRSE